MKEKKKPCNCGKKTLEAVAPYTEEGAEVLNKSILRKVFDFFMTILARIFASVLFTIIGLVIIPVIGVIILFTGTNDFGINITKIMNLGRNAKR